MKPSGFFRRILAPIAAIGQRATQSIVANLALEAGLAQMGSFPNLDAYEASIQHALESWPRTLHALSVPSAGFPLTAQEHTALTAWFGEGSVASLGAEGLGQVWFHPAEALAAIRVGTRSVLDDAIIAGLIDRINLFLWNCAFDRPFFKLGTRAPKDTPLFRFSGGRVSCGEQVVLLLLTSRRLFGDLGANQVYRDLPDDAPIFATAREMQAAALAMPLEEFAALLGITDLAAADALRRRPIRPNHAPWLWFRDYRPIAPATEFRCFMKNGEYAGATQYHGIYSTPGDGIIAAEPFPELVAHGPEYDRILREWFPVFRAAATTMQSAVYDVTVDRAAGTVTLLETNPVAKSTFPGLKDWNRPQTFNGELDWVAQRFERPPEIWLSQSQLAELATMIRPDHGESWSDHG